MKDLVRGIHRSWLRCGWYLVFLGFGVSAIGQDAYLDSLDAEISAAASEQSKMELMLQATDHAMHTDESLVEKYTSQLFDLRIVQQDSSLLMNTLRIEAAGDRWTGNYVASTEKFKQCYAYYKYHQDTANIIFVADHLGSMSVFTGYNTEAQKYLFEVYDLEKARGDLEGIGNATNGLAIFYTNIGQDDKGIERYYEALEIFEQINDTMGQANVHANLGLTFVEQGKFEKAEYHLGQQGRLDSLLDYPRGLGFHFDFMGYLRSEQGRHEEAYEMHTTALKIREGLASNYNISESRVCVAASLYELGRYDEAIEQAQIILDENTDKQSLSHEQRAYEVLADAHEAKKNYAQALSYHKQYKLISDSIFNQDILDKVAEMDAKFDLAEREAEIAVLDAKNANAKLIIDQKSRTIVLASIGLGLVTILSIVLWFVGQKYLRQRRILAKANEDKDTLLREIHHRVKNNLQVVSSLLSLQGRSISDEAALKAINDGKRRVRSMALIHQDLYQHDNLMGVNVKSYLVKLCRELFATYKIDEDRVKLNLDIEDVDIDIDTLVPLGLIINELVTNSLKYAFPDERLGQLNINLKEDAQQLKLTVADNGVGYDVKDSTQGSFGTKLINTLIKQLRGEMTLFGNQGTEVSIAFSKYKLSRREG